MRKRWGTSMNKNQTRGGIITRNVIDEKLYLHVKFLYIVLDKLLSTVSYFGMIRKSLIIILEVCSFVDITFILKKIVIVVSIELLQIQCWFHHAQRTIFRI